MNNSTRILLHLVLIAIWAGWYAFLFYNALEYRFLNDPLPGYLGLCGLPLVLTHLIFLVIRIIRSFVTKQYVMSFTYLVLVVGLGFVGKAGVFVTMIHFGMGTAG